MPPGRTPSTHGWASSRRRPASPASRTASGRRSEVGTSATRSTPRPRSTHTAPSPLTRTSVTDGSRTTPARGPRPTSRSARRSGSGRACGHRGRRPPRRATCAITSADGGTPARIEAATTVDGPLGFTTPLGVPRTAGRDRHGAGLRRAVHGLGDDDVGAATHRVARHPGNSPRSASRATPSSSRRWCRWRDAEVGGDVAEDIAARPPAPRHEAEVGLAGSRRRDGGEEPLDRDLGVGETAGAQRDEEDDEGRPRHHLGDERARGGDVEDAGHAAVDEGGQDLRDRGVVRAGAVAAAADRTWQPPSPGRVPARRRAGTRPRTSRRSGHRRPGRCSTPAVTSSPPDVGARSATTTGGPARAARRRPTARARVLAPRPPEAPTTAVGGAAGSWSEASPAARSPCQARPETCGRRPPRRAGLWTTARGATGETARPPRPGPRPGRTGPVADRRRGGRPGPGRGTAPVGGTTGAVGEPSSGGEKPVRRSLNPEGERVDSSCPWGPIRASPAVHLRDSFSGTFRTTESVGLDDNV